MNPIPQVPSSAWVPWIYSSVTSESQWDCIDQCRQDSDCQAAIFIKEESKCYLGNINGNHNVVSSNQDKTVFFNDGKWLKIHLIWINIVLFRRMSPEDIVVHEPELSHLQHLQAKSLPRGLGRRMRLRQFWLTAFGRPGCQSIHQSICLARWGQRSCLDSGSGVSGGGLNGLHHGRIKFQISRQVKTVSLSGFIYSGPPRLT